MDVVRRHQCHILLPAGCVGESIDMRSQGVVGNVYDGGNTRIKLTVTTVWVVATNFVATTRPEGAA